MKLLICSTDLDDLERVVKRLVCARIPCAVCKDPGSFRISVWIQQDFDFPLALRAVANREARARLPHWARVLEWTPPAVKDSASPTANEMQLPSRLFAQPKVPTWTGTARPRPLGPFAPQRQPAKAPFRPLPSADGISDPTVNAVALACGKPA